MSSRIQDSQGYINTLPQQKIEGEHVNAFVDKKFSVLYIASMIYTVRARTSKDCYIVSLRESKQKKGKDKKEKSYIALEESITQRIKDKRTLKRNPWVWWVVHAFNRSTGDRVR